MKFNSIKSKVLFWFIGILSTILLLFSFLLYFLLEKNIHGDIKASLQEKSTFIQKHLLTNPETLNKQTYNDILNIDFMILKNNEKFYISENFPLNKLEDYLSNQNNFYIYESIHNTENAMFKTKFHDPYNGEIILVTKSISDDAERIQDILIYLIPILLLIVIFVGNSLINKILDPIKSLTKVAKKTSILEIPKTIETPKSNDEIKELINAFNDMTKRLNNGIESLNSFNSDISHELKTPLTVVIAELELALEKTREPEFYMQTMRTIKSEINQIKKIIDSLLLFTKYSKENIEATFTETYLDSIILNVINKFEKQAQKKNISVNIDNLDTVQKKVNSQLISIIFSNLLDNAIKYSDNGTNIYISLLNIDNKTCLTIRDEGIGIKQEYIHKLTDKFYRVDSSRNKSIQGFGLGLAIVKNFVDLHNGTIEIQSNIDQGTEINVCL